jgi:hypothetical protein
MGTIAAGLVNVDGPFLPATSIDSRYSLLLVTHLCEIVYMASLANSRKLIYSPEYGYVWQSCDYVSVSGVPNHQ